MKRFSIFAFVISISAICNVHPLYAENQVISLLKEVPRYSIDNCSANEVMGLLTAESSDWVESMECGKVNIVKNRPGVEMTSTNTEDTPAYIKFNFKKDKLMKMFRIRVYGASKNNSNAITVVCNGKEILKGNLNSNNAVFNSMDAEAIESCMKKGSGTLLPSYVMNGADLTFEDIPVSSLEITKPGNSDFNDCQIYGIQIFYNGTVDGSESENGGTVATICGELIADKVEPVVYYDMMGRILPNEPAHGIYIRRTGNKSEKVIAH